MIPRDTVSQKTTVYGKVSRNIFLYHPKQPVFSIQWKFPGNGGINLRAELFVGLSILEFSLDSSRFNFVGFELSIFKSVTQLFIKINKMTLRTFEEIDSAIERALSIDYIKLGKFNCYLHSHKRENTNAERIGVYLFLQLRSFEDGSTLKDLSEKTFTSFLNEVSDDNFSEFIREYLKFIEFTLGLKNHHIRICSDNYTLKYPEVDKHSNNTKPIIDHLKSTKECKVDKGWFIFTNAVQYFSEVSFAPNPFNSVKDEDFIRYTDKSGTVVNKSVTHGDIVLLNNEDMNSRAVFDGQGRSVYIIVSNRKVKKNLLTNQNQLTDKEISHLWRLCIETSKLKLPKDETDTFLDIRINTGTFQNIRSIHFKVFMEEALFKDIWSSSNVYQALIQE